MNDTALLIDEIYERAIGERAVVCKNWMWGAGMLVSVPPEKGSEKRTLKRLSEGQSIPRNSGYLPVFKDAATRGCLLALVRKAYGKEAVVILSSMKENVDSGAVWQISIDGKPISKATYHSEAEALVSALEASNGY